ncbi:hypothetical protein [Endozoicomonas sp. 4G]|uniref:hypothetical protein n=1 Tax=Endozoicomonas sp. 4G TaxID=2872754 RepID=UPI0020785878|nr:hypothetical protein [Endozoicomonas sp. 4G]
MIKLQHYLARLIALVFLLQTLSLQAQGVATTTTTPTVSCDSLKGQTSGVRDRLSQYKGLVRGRQCVVFSTYPDPSGLDLGTEVSRIPENTVILLSSNTIQRVTPTPAPSVNPTTGKIAVTYWLGTPIVLKDGQDLIGAADDGFEIVITGTPNFNIPLFVDVGSADKFLFDQTKPNHIKHITFEYIQLKGTVALNNVILAKCYNRKLIVEDNVFKLANQFAVSLDCKEPLDASANATGPGLRFANNTVTGQTLIFRGGLRLVYIPEGGVFINLPEIKNPPQKIEVIENTFQSRMAIAGEFMLGARARLDVFRNTVNSTNDALTLREAKGLRNSPRGGFALNGHTDPNEEPPRFNLAGNQVQTTETAITVTAPLKLALACNRLQGMTPWLQLKPELSLKAVDAFPLTNECERRVSSSVVMPVLNSTTAIPALNPTAAMPASNSTAAMPTYGPHAISKIENIWTAIGGSNAMACCGLINVEGLLYFKSAVCPTAICPSPSSSVAVATSSIIPTTVATSTAVPIIPCDSLTGQKPGVQKRLDQYKELVRGRQCAVLSADPAGDTAKLINQIPENTVILFSSNIHQVLSSSPSVTPATGDTTVNYLIDSEILLKDGQDLIGAADDGFEIVIKLSERFAKPYMVRVGSTDNFHFDEIRDSHIEHITFLPAGPRYLKPVNAIVSAGCHNRKLIVESNLFHLPNWAAVDLDCRKSLDASASDNRPGPGLLFTNNTAIGDTISMLHFGVIPEGGIIVNLPAIRNQAQRLAVIGNRFRGKMANAGDFNLGPGSSIDVFRNTIDNIDNAGLTLRETFGLREQRRGGFALISHADNTVKPPLFNLAGNQIRVTATAITFRAPLELALACNHLQGIVPWRQLEPEFSLKASDALPLGGECQRVMSSTLVMSTPGLNTFMATSDSINIMSTLNSFTVMPTLSSTNVMPTLISAAGMSILNSTHVMPAWNSSTVMPTLNSTNIMPTLISAAAMSILNSTHVMPALNSSTVMPALNSTNIMPILNSTNVMPALNSSTVMPTLNSTNIMPILNSTNVMPALNSSTVMPTLNSTNVMPALNSSTVMPTLNSTNVMPILNSTNIMPALNSSTVMPTLNSTNVMPALNSSTVMPTLNSTNVMPALNSTSVMPTTSSYTIAEIKNTWTAIRGSTATACSGLINVEGILLFDSAACTTLISSSLAIATSSSSAISTTSTITSTSATPTTTTELPIVPCESIIGHASGIQKRLNQYEKLVRQRQCVVLSPDPAGDFSELIKRIPDNTVILLSSSAATPTTAVPSAGKTAIHYLIGSEIVLKNGQDIIGAADDGFEIVISPLPDYFDQHMLRVGSTRNFYFDETRDSHIRQVTFRPTESRGRYPIQTIVFAECYNRRLIIEDSVFHLSNWAGVDLDCRLPLDASANDLRPGPGLRFANNTVTGNIIKTLLLDYIPDKGVVINLPAIRNQSKQIALIGNRFQGNMTGAGEFTLGHGTRMDVFRNNVDIDNTGKTRKALFSGVDQQRGGFTLTGHKDINAELPLFNLAGNQIRVTDTAISIREQLELALACNHLQAFNPWRQAQQEYRLIAADPLPLANECQRSMGSTHVIRDHTPLTISQILNTWTAIHHSTATALSGLVNFEGQFFFELSDLTTEPPVSIADTISSSRAVITGLSIITTLAVLYRYHQDL